MSLIYPDTYQNASGLELANTLKRLFSYTTSNALYNDFDTSYNNFFTGKAAMVPNGYWMIDQIPDGWEQCGSVFSSFPWKYTGFFSGNIWLGTVVWMQ